VNRHHGQISLQSRLGKGTTITMTLPVGVVENE
jgi:signal transduction histidine kinase